MTKELNDPAITWGDLPPSTLKLAKALGINTAKKAVAALHWVDEKFMELGPGSVARLGEAYLGWQIDWDDPEQKQFRYHNQDIYRYVATAMRASAEVALKGDYWTNPRGFTGAVADWMEQDGGEWARRNPDTVDAILQFGLSPWWFSGKVLTVLKQPLIRYEIKQLQAVLREAADAWGKFQVIPRDPMTIAGSVDLAAYKALGGKSSFANLYGINNPVKVIDKGQNAADLAIAKTYGAPIGNWTRSVVKAVQRGKMSAENAAAELYARGYRVVGGPSHRYSIALDAIRPKFFRWPENLYSADIRDVAIRKLEVQDALRHNWAQAWDKVRDALPHLTNAEARQASEILLTIGRPQWLAPARVGDFIEMSMHELLLSGKWRGPAPTPDAIRAAGVLGGFLKQGHREGTRYDPKYLAQVKKIFGEQPQNATLAKKARPWRREHVLPRKPTDDLEGMTKAVATVLTREFRADRIDALRRFAAHRIKEFRELKRVDPKQADRWGKAIDDILDAVKSVEDWGKRNWDIKEGGGVLLKHWDTVVNFFRSQQLMPFGIPNPGWVIKNAFDTHIIKNVMGAWDPAILTHQPMMRRLNGKPLEAGTTMARDILGRSPAANFVDYVEKSGRQKLLSFEYQRRLAQSIARGTPVKLAEEAAYNAAKELERLVHINYEWLSGFEQVAKRLWAYPKFHAGNLNIWAARALEHPAEAVALLKATEFQHEHLAMDRKGNISIPALGVAINPQDLASHNKMMTALADPSEPIEPEQAPLAEAVKAAQVLYGPLTPPLEAIKRRLSDDWRGETMVDTLVGSVPLGNIAKSLVRHPDMRQVKFLEPPPGRTWETLFTDPETDPIRLRQIRYEMAAALAEGRTMGMDEAADIVDRRNFTAQVMGFGTGLWPRPTGPGYEAIEQKKDLYLRLWQKYIDDLSAKGDYDGARAAQIAREVFLEENPDLQLLNLPRFPGMEQKIFEKIREIEQNQESADKVFEQMKEAEPEAKQSFLLGVPTELFAKAKAALADLQFVRAGPFTLPVPASTAEAKTDAPAVAPAEPVRLEKKGRYVVPAGGPQLGKTSGLNFIRAKTESARQELKWADHVKELESRSTTLGQASYISQNPDFKAYLELKAKDNASWAQQALRSLDAPYGTAELHRSVSENRKRSMEAMRQAVENRLAKEGPAAARELWEAMADPNRAPDIARSFAPPGTDVDELRDAQALRLLRSRLDQSVEIMISRGEKALRDETFNRSTSVGRYARELQEYANRYPFWVKDKVDEIDDKIENGELPGDFWTKLESADPVLFNRVAVADRHRLHETIASDIAFYDEHGRFVGVSPLAVLDLARKGYGPAIGALRLGHGGPVLRDALNRMEGIDRVAPLDEGFIFGSFGDDFKRRVGTYRPGFLDELAAPGDFVRAGGGDFPAPPPPDFVRRRPAGSIEHYQTTMPDIVRQQRPRPLPRFNTIGDWVAYNIRETATKNANRQEGEPPVGLMTTAAQNITALPAANTLRGMASVYNLANDLGIDMPNEVHRSFGGLGTAFSAVGAMQLLAPTGFATGPYGLAIAGTLGILKGAGILGRKPKESEAIKIQRRRLEEERAFREQMRVEQERQQSILSLRDRESILARALQDPETRRRALQGSSRQLEAFRRRPTFASRIGLIDSLTRELGPALRPSY